MTENRTFQAALLDPIKPVPANLKDGRGRPAKSRFDIYRNNVVASLINGLESGFPMTRAFVGAKYFKLLAGKFVRIYLPQNPLMPLYGEEFSEFLSHNIPCGSHPYLSDIARLEYAIRLSYHSADSEEYDWSTLGHLNEDDLKEARVTFIPSVFLVTSDWPLFDIWIRSKINSESAVKETQSVLVVRPEFDPYPVLLPQSSQCFFRTLKDGMPLGLAIERASNTPGFDLKETLELFAKHRCVRNIEIPK